MASSQKLSSILGGAGKDDDTVDKVLAEIEKRLQELLGPFDFLYDYFMMGNSPIPPNAYQGRRKR